MKGTSTYDECKKNVERRYLITISDFFYINPQIIIPIVISSRVGVRLFMTDGWTDGRTVVCHNMSLTRQEC